MKLREVVPLFDWLPGYQRPWLRADVVAGLTTAAVVIPKSMAYATVAGLPIQVGLYTAFIPMLIYAMLGTSRPLSVTTSTTLAILTGAALGAVAPDGDTERLMQATAVLTLMVGAILVIASVMRLGFVANFISEPVLVGFKAGIAVVIIVDQIPKILGIHFPKGTFLENVAAIGHGFPGLSALTLSIGIMTIASLVLIEKYLPRWPAPLIVVGGAIAGAGLFGWHALGIELVGAIPSGLPPLTLPDLGLASQLWPAAIGIALMSFTETIAAGRAFVAKNEPSPRPNAELLATGLANAGGALLGSMPAGGGTSQTAVNRTTGAKTQVAGLVTASVTVLTMLFLAPLIGLMPQATLAAVVIVYSVGLIHLADFRSILRVRRTEFIWAIVAFLGVMMLGTLKGILVAIIVSLVALGYQVANPPVYVLGRKRGTNIFRPRSDVHTDDEFFPGLLIVRLEGRLFFINVEHVAEKIRPLVAEAIPAVVLLDLSGVFDLEYSALKALTDAERRMSADGISVWLAGLTPNVLESVRRSPLGNTLGEQRMFFNVESAVARFLENGPEKARIQS